MAPRRPRSLFRDDRAKASDELRAEARRAPRPAAAPPPRPPRSELPWWKVFGTSVLIAIVLSRIARRQRARRRRIAAASARRPSRGGAADPDGES